MSGSQQEAWQQGKYLFMSPAGQVHRPLEGAFCSRSQHITGKGVII